MQSYILQRLSQRLYHLEIERTSLSYPLSRLHHDGAIQGTWQYAFCSFQSFFITLNALDNLVITDSLVQELGVPEETYQILQELQLSAFSILLHCRR